MKINLKILFAAIIFIFSFSILMALMAFSVFALSDAEYTQLMKDASFAKADRALAKSWQEAQRTLMKNKTALANLRKDQREWIAQGRDAEAEDLMKIKGYGRVKAYSLATNTRAEYLPELAQKYIGGGAAAKNTNNKNTARIQANMSEKYPTLGMCTGNGVRLRDNPWTNSNVIGRANDMDILVLLGERKVNGDIWYAVDNPIDSGTVWISGQYIDTYKGDYSDTPAFKMSLEVRMNYGIKPEKARALFGEPDKLIKDTFFFDTAGRELREDTYEYSGFTLRYVEDRLRHVEIFGGDLKFGALSIGSTREELIKILGKPEENTDAENITYEVSPIEEFLFELEDDAIVRMTWDEYMDN